MFDPQTVPKLPKPNDMPSFLYDAIMALTSANPEERPLVSVLARQFEKHSPPPKNFSSKQSKPESNYEMPALAPVKTDGSAIVNNSYEN